MRIAAAWLATFAACSGSAPEPVPSGPSCERAWAAITASFEELHREAGKPMPTPPDRSAWIATCQGLALPDPVLGCLEPAEAIARPVECAAALEAIDRSALDRPFLDAMLTDQENTP